MRLTIILAGLLLIICQIKAQNNAQISTDEPSYNFGTIAEENGPASHTFIIKNTGTGPLVITRITASCGCTQPEWSKEPISPGQTGEVTVTYNPKGRPGPFYKTISLFSNAKKSNYTLGIKGNVTPKPLQPVFIYPYSIGDLKLQSKTVLFSTIRPDESLGERIQVINEGKTTLTIHAGKTPHYLIAEVLPTIIKPGETGEITFLLNAKEAKRKGRITTELPIILEGPGQKEIESKIHVAANIIDDFSNMTATEKTQAPVAQLSETLLEFGKLPSKGSIIPLIGNKVSGTIDISNTGNSSLIIYSVTCDDEVVDISGGKREVKPGSTVTFKVTLRPRDIKTKLESLINIVCNDPKGPVRLVKVTAEK